MVSATHSRGFRLSMFGLVYFVQGSALAYFRNFQKPYLDDLNVDVDVIGSLTSILLLPFILKVFIGMLSDRVNLFGWGHRKPYVVLGLLLAALTFGATGFVAPEVHLGRTMSALRVSCGCWRGRTSSPSSFCGGCSGPYPKQTKALRVLGTLRAWTLATNIRGGSYLVA